MRNGPTCRPRLFTQDRPARCYFQSLGRNLQPTTRDFDVRNSGKGTLAPKRLLFLLFVSFPGNKQTIMQIKVQGFFLHILHQLTYTGDSSLLLDNQQGASLRR